MTLIIAWLDESHGLQRLSAVADSRSSGKTEGGDRAVYTDHTPKLFAVPVHCHRLASLNGVGAWEAPYHRSVVGLAFTGTCFECLAVKSHIEHVFGQLTQIRDDAEQPSHLGLICLAQQILDRFIKSHAFAEKLTLRFLLFGWTPDGKPWLSKFGWHQGERDDPKTVWASPSVIWAIGTDPDASATAARIRRLNSRRMARPGITDLEKALIQCATAAAAEDAVKRVVEMPDFKSVGGYLERLDLSPSADPSVGVSVSYSHSGDNDFLQRLQTVGSDLGYVPIVAEFGSPSMQTRP